MQENFVDLPEDVFMVFINASRFYYETFKEQLDEKIEHYVTISYHPTPVMALLTPETLKKAQYAFYDYQNKFLDLNCPSNFLNWNTITSIKIGEQGEEKFSQFFSLKRLLRNKSLEFWQFSSHVYRTYHVSFDFDAWDPAHNCNNFLEFYFDYKKFEQIKYGSKNQK